MGRWLLLSNCQTFGLANSMMLASPGLNVAAVDLWAYRAEAARYNAMMSEYDRLLVHPDVARLAEFDASHATHVNYVPSLEVGAYHPDAGYFAVDEIPVDGPMVNYLSMLAVAAYEVGLSFSEARALYTGPTYEACGYMRRWQSDRDSAINTFANHGIDIAAPIRRWGRERAFMYSVNHPRIDVLWDIACIFLRALGMEVADGGVRPPDNLVAGPCLAVYPEIAEALGVQGSHLYKVGGAYRYLTLDEVLAASFAAFEAYPRGAIRPHPHYQHYYDRTLAVVRGQA